MDNRTIAERLTNYAHYLAARDANLYRVQAYRRAAQTILSLDRPVAEIVAERGRDGLEELAGIGAHLSYTIEGLVRTGEFRTLDGEGGHMDSTPGNHAASGLAFPSTAGGRPTSSLDATDY